MPNLKDTPNQISSFRITKAPVDYSRLILLVLAAIVVALSIYLAYINTILNYEELSILTHQLALPKKTILELGSPQTEYQIGEVIEVKISLKTEVKKTQGIDVLLKYDPKTLALLTVKKEKEDFSKIAGEVRADPLEYLNIQNSPFDIFPYFSINEKEGVINFSALAKPLQQIGGKVEVASLSFQALKEGEASLDFVFEKGKTDDTNVAFYGRDILERVMDLKLIILK